MHHMGETFDYHVVCLTCAARLAQPPHLIAAQINRHRVLGNLSVIGQQFYLARLISF